MAKPAEHLDWVTDDDAAKQVEPTGAKRLLGWIQGERPPFQWMNWTFWVQDKWNKYFEAQTDVLLARLIEHYDAIIDDTGTNAAATHDTLALAVADGALGANARVLILASQTINTTVDLTKSYWRITCAPGVTFTKGSVTTGISMNAEGIEWFNGRFVGFTTGGDKAIALTAQADYAKVIGTRFVVSTDTEIDESLVTAGKKPVVSQTISEV